MKRRLLALLLAVLTLTMLTAAAFAEDTEVLGVYNVTGPLTVTNGTKDGGFYAGADTFMSEDPYLAGEMAVPLIEGIQKADVVLLKPGRANSSGEMKVGDKEKGLRAR